MHILATTEVKVTLTLQPDDLRNKQPVLHIRTLRLPMPVAPKQNAPQVVATGFASAPAERARHCDSPFGCSHALAHQAAWSVPSSKSRTGSAGNYLGAHSKHCGRRPRGSAGATGLAPARCFSAEPLCLAGSFAKNSTGERPSKAALRIYRPPLLADVQIARQTARRNLLRRYPQTRFSRLLALSKPAGNGGQKPRGLARNGTSSFPRFVLNFSRILLPTNRKKMPSIASTAICIPNAGSWKESTIEIR